jgi:hypothetical protein
VVQQLPHSPDLPLAELPLFLKLKASVESHHFEAVGKVQEETRISSKSCVACWEKWNCSWKHVGMLEGMYILKEIMCHEIYLHLMLVV